MLYTLLLLHKIVKFVCQQCGEGEFTRILWNSVVVYKGEYPVS